VITIKKKTKSQSKFQDGYYFSWSNTFACYSAADLAIHNVTKVPINKEAVLMDKWYLHPNQDVIPVMVNAAGTHLRNTLHGGFKQILRYESKFSDHVEHRVSVKGKHCQFSRVAVECFTGIELGELTVDHFNHDRDDNSKENLSAQGILFQANNRKCQLPRDDGTHCGVTRHDNAQVNMPHWRAHWRIITPDGITGSVPGHKDFYDRHYGDDPNESYKHAVALREKIMPRPGCSCRNAIKASCRNKP
jgi:hypothetical protein